MGRRIFQTWIVLAVCGLVGLTMPHGAPATTRSSLVSAHGAVQTDVAVHPPRSAPSAPTDTLQQTWASLSDGTGLTHSRVSAYAYDMTTHQVLAALNPSERLTPGSVTKLFTSAAALAELGPQFTYKTRVMVPSSTLLGKVGPIYLVGGGNPWLEANGRHDLEELAQSVAARVSHATQVIGVNSLFAPPTYGIGWPIGGIPQNYSAGTSALMAERSEVAVLVQGANRPGLPPHISLAFNGTARDPDYFTIINRARTVGARTRPTIAVTRVIGTNHLVVTGRIAENTSVSPLFVSVGNPALFAASLFQSALTQRGVSFQDSSTTRQTLPDGLTSIASNTSLSLSAELPLQNQYSINQMAENLYRELSVATTGLGSLSGSAAVMASFTAQAGVTGYREQVDGSGLSPLDQMSALQVVQLLTYAAAQPWFLTFQDSLIQINNPTACGFLCPPAWHLSLPRHTSIWVKPGNLANQWNLAGYVRSVNNNLIAFAILDDGTPTAQNMQPHSDVTQMMESIATWPRVPVPAHRATPASTTGQLPMALQSVVSHIPGYDSGSSLSVAVVNVANHRTIFQENGETLVPSGLSPRLMLAIAALQQLSARTLPPCQVLTTGELTTPTLAGPIILNGNGNNLTKAQMQDLAAGVRAHGIIRITGPIEYVSPTPGFQQTRWPAGLPWEALGQGWASPSSRLYVNSDQVFLTINALVQGSPAQLTLSPNQGGLRIVNDTTVAAASAAPRLTVRLPFHARTFVVSGTIPLGYRATQTLAPPDPGLLAALQFQHDLARDGITVAQPPVAIPGVPADAQTLANSPGQSIAAIAQQSLNTASLVPPDQLMQSLGPDLSKDMAALLDHSPTSVTDWSGGAIGNYMTAGELAQALARAHRQEPEQPLVHSLSARLWESASPEQYDILGYMAGPGHTVDAVVILASSLKWTGQFAPRIVSP